MLNSLATIFERWDHILELEDELFTFLKTNRHTFYNQVFEWSKISDSESDFFFPMWSYVHHGIKMFNDLESTDDIVYGTEALNLN
jgi:hypothetical protein